MTSRTATAARSGAATDTTAEQVRRVADLIPTLAGCALETIAARRVLPANIERLKTAGAFKILQPSRCGGLECSLHTHIDVVEAAAHGCGSTGWVLGVMQAHSWLLGLFEQRAQDDVYSANVDARISAVIGPRGKAQPAAGGYTLSGFWSFCSGCHHADWLILGEMISDTKGQVVDSGVMVIPASAAEIQDDWYTGGLTGTGSNSVVVKNLFVPTHRFLSVPAAIDGKSPGAGLHASNLYHSAAIPALALFIATPALGMARRALQLFKERLPGRIVSYTFDEKQQEMSVTHMEVAEAATKLDVARTLLHAMVDEIEHYAKQRTVMPFERRAKARMDCAFAVRLCLESTQTLYTATGGGGLAESSPIQAAHRDLQAVNMHGLLTLKTNLEMYGRVLLGLAPNSPVI